MYLGREAYAATNKKSLKTKGFHASFILRDDLFWGMDECFCRQRRRFASTLPSFLALMQEKKQKKIKASAEAGEVGRVRDRWSVGPGRVFTLLTVRSSGAYGWAGVWGG